MNVGTIGSYIREQREQAKISLRQLAQAAGVSNPYLSQIERGLRRPSADILQQIAKGLRISAEALYVQAGFLEDRGPGSQVRDAVLVDTELTERQKQMLLEIYDSFRKQTVAAATGHGDDSDAALSGAALGPRALTAEAGPGDPWADPDAGPFADSDAGPWADPDAISSDAGDGDGGGADGSEFPSDQANR